MGFGIKKDAEMNKGLMTKQSGIVDTKKTADKEELELPESPIRARSGSHEVEAVGLVINTLGGEVRLSDLVANHAIVRQRSRSHTVVSYESEQAFISPGIPAASPVGFESPCVESKIEALSFFTAVNSASSETFAALSSESKKAEC